MPARLSVFGLRIRGGSWESGENFFSFTKNPLKDNRDLNDLPDLHSAPGRNAVGLLAGYRLQSGAGDVPGLPAAPAPAASTVKPDRPADPFFSNQPRKLNMKTISQLNKSAADADTLLRKIEAVRNRFRADADLITNDAKLNPDFIRTEVKKLQDAALSQLGQHMNPLSELVVNVASDLPFWRSLPYFLSRQRFFPEDPVLDNAVRLRHSTELSKSPDGLLSLMFLDSLAEKNWALAFSIWREGNSRDKMPASIDLASVPPIPEQAMGLALISKVLSSTGQAHAFVAQITGRRIDSPLADARSQIPEEILPSLNFELPQLARKPPDVVVQQVGTPAERMSQHRATLAAAG